MATSTSLLSQNMLPYPLNLLPVSGRMIPITMTDTIIDGGGPYHHHHQQVAQQHFGAGGNLFPGYVGLRKGTFRDRYPSTTVNGTGTFDAIFVLSSSRCARHLKKFRGKAKERGLLIEPWAISTSVSISDPPLPLAGNDGSAIRGGGIGGSSAKLVPAVLWRELAYTDAQVRLWRHVLNAGLQRVLILDETLFPTKRLLGMLPTMMVGVDTESVARAQPWHIVYLRRTVLRRKYDNDDSNNNNNYDELSESIWSWSIVGSGHNKRQMPVTIANVSHGAGAYILSMNGAQFLLDHVTSFAAPLDIQFGMLQRQYPNQFIALSVCEAQHDKPFCPDNTMDISQPRLNDDPESVSFDCTWRRSQEAQTANEFAEMLGTNYNEYQ